MQKTTECSVSLFTRQRNRPLCFSLFPQFSAVLGAQFVGTFRALKSHIAVFPEPFRVCKHTQLPHNPDYNSKCQKSPGVKTSCNYKWREHHKVIPIKNTAGSTSFVFHNKPKGAPYKNTNKVAHIKGHSYKK